MPVSGEEAFSTWHKINTTSFVAFYGFLSQVNHIFKIFDFYVFFFLNVNTSLFMKKGEVTIDLFNCGIQTKQWHVICKHRSSSLKEEGHLGSFLLHHQSDNNSKISIQVM